MRTSWCLLFLLAFASCTHQQQPQQSKDRHVVMVQKEDAEMNAAIEHARETLPAFWKEFEHPAADEGEFYVKLAITDRGRTEHFWIGKIRREGGRLYGVVENDPETVKNVKYGQKIAIDESKITDWKYEKAGVTKGGYTIAVLLKRIPGSEADEIRKALGWK